MKKLCLQIGGNSFLRLPDAMTMEDIMLILEQAEIVDLLGNKVPENINLGIKYIDVKSLDVKKEIQTTGVNLLGNAGPCCIAEADEAFTTEYPVTTRESHA